MTKVTNISNGPRGLFDAGGFLVMLDKGQTKDIDLAKGEEAGEWFEFDGTAPVSAEPGPLDQSVPELEAYLASETDLDAVQALIDAETAGKSRKGALAVLEARRDELLA
jgi:hypothetical protein